jgi:RNA polymerase sigma factor (sigma-70 family)
VLGRAVLGQGQLLGHGPDPVATAASNNPVLSTLVTAVKKAEQVQTRLEREQVRHCLETLTEVQRESVTLAYYGGYTYREVAELLDAALGTIKTRMGDGLIRLRGCLGVER